MLSKSVSKSGHNVKEMVDNYVNSSSVVLPQRHLALISLSLGFLVIWTAVISGVLVSHTFRDNVSAKESLKIFQTHKQIGKIVFAIGHEMVSTVDWLVSIGPKQRPSLSIDEAIGITWKMTDSVISDIRDEINVEDFESLSNLLSLVELKLAKFRGSHVFVSQNPLNVIKFYDELCEIIERKSYLLVTLSNGAILKRQIPLPSTSYAFFIKGMAKRFAELSFGTVYVKSDILVNKSDYFHYHYSSRELIENAFQLNPRAQNRYWELQESDRTAQVLINLMDENQKRDDNHFASLYLNSVKNEIAILLRAKDFLNASLSIQVSQLAAISQKVLVFHLSIAIIAMAAVILCMALLCCSFRYTDIKQNIFSYKFDNSKFGYNHERNDTVYSLEFDDKTKILGKSSYQKQFF